MIESSPFIKNLFNIYIEFTVTKIRYQTTSIVFIALIHNVMLKCDQ